MMQSCGFRILFLALAVTASVPTGTCWAQQDLGDEIRQAVSRAAPAVVRIRILGTADAGAAGTISSRVTTGVVISAEGDILTSAFGLDGQPAAVFVEDSSGQRTAAKVVATDHLRKLVLLKCAEGDFQPPTFAEEDPAVGAWAIAVGRLYPGDQPASSLGIVSATNRIHGLAIQTDAKISPVNYGGPLLDLQGQVTGILVPLSPQASDTGVEAGVEWYDSGIGFAIPAADALESARQLQQGTDRKVGLMGISLSTRNPLAEDFQVSEVRPGSPAAEAGLQAGDRIVAAAGEQISRFGVLESVVRSHYAGERLPLTIERDGQQQELNVTLVDRLPQVDPGWLGLVAHSTATPDAAEEPGTVVSVFPDSPAAAAGLPQNCVIVSIADQSTTDAAEFASAVMQLEASQTVTIKYHPTVAAEITTAEIQTVSRPTQVPELSDQQVQQLLSDGQSAAAAEPDWSRQQTDLGPLGRAWLYAPAAVAGADSEQAAAESQVTFGLIVLVSATGQAEELLLKTWRPICEQHRLILAVPQSSEQRNLSREDVKLLTATVAHAAETYSLDARRIVLFSDKDQLELATQLLLNARLPALRNLAVQSGWPRISEAAGELLTRKDAALLLLEPAAVDSEQTALRNLAVQRLQDAGVRVSTVAADDETSEELQARQISRWALLLKAR